MRGSMEQLEAEQAKDTAALLNQRAALDDGKSTLIGQLLYDSRNVYDNLQCGYASMRRLISPN